MVGVQCFCMLFIGRGEFLGLSVLWGVLIILGGLCFILVFFFVYLFFFCISFFLYYSGQFRLLAGELCFCYYVLYRILLFLY